MLTRTAPKVLVTRYAILDACDLSNDHGLESLSRIGRIRRYTIKSDYVFNFKKKLYIIDSSTWLDRITVIFFGVGCWRGGCGEFIRC